MESSELTFFLKDHCTQNRPWVRLEQGEWEESHCTGPGGPDRWARGSDCGWTLKAEPASFADGLI